MVKWGRAWRAAVAWFGWSIVWGLLSLILTGVGVVLIAGSLAPFLDYFNGLFSGGSPGNIGNLPNISYGGIIGGFALIIIGYFIFILGVVASFFKINSEITSEEVKRQMQTLGLPTQPSGPLPATGAAGMTCPTCGGPLRYIQQYQKWYCDREGKYV